MSMTGHWMRIAAAGLTATVILALPATALADQPVVTPTVNCISVNADGSFSALFGFSNTGLTTTLIKRGPDNQITPSNLDGAQPDTFAPGTTDGAFSLAIPAGGTATWTLHGNHQAVASISSPHCDPPVSLPQEGNGLGLVIGLIVAAIVGTLTIRKIVTRAAAQT
jgi:hypothetical protein